MPHQISHLVQVKYGKNYGDSFMDTIQKKIKRNWISALATSITFFSIGSCSNICSQIQDQHMLWCCIAEQDDASSNDAIVQTLKALIGAQTCAILTSNHLFSFIKFNDDDLLEIEKEWRIFDYNNTLTLMIPYGEKYVDTFKSALESEEFFTAASLEEQLSDNTGYVPYSGVFAHGLEKLLINETAPLFLALTGHGTYFDPSSYTDENSFTQQKKICGMQLCDIVSIGKILQSKNTKALFVQTCYGSSSDVGSILGKENFNFPIISGGFYDSYASAIGMHAKNILQFNGHLKKISQFTEEKQENLFNAMDAILMCDKAPNNIPYVLWPQKPQFSILNPLPQPTNTSNPDNQIRVHHSLILTQPDIKAISLNDGETIIAGGAMCPQPRRDYTIDELDITTLKDDPANTSHPQTALLKHFNNLGSKKKNVFKIKKTHFHYNGHIFTYKNIRILCKQGVTGVMYSNNQNKCFIAEQQYQTNDIAIRPCIPPSNDSF